MRVRSPRKILAAVSSVAFTIALTGLATAPVHAAGETLELRMNSPARISGEAWPVGSSVKVCRGAQELGNPQTDSAGWFMLYLDRNAHVGESYTVTVGGTCAVPGTTSKSVVASLTAPTVDVEQGWIYGTGGTGWPQLMANVGNQYDGVKATDTVTPNPDGTWAAYAGTDAFDLMKGVGVEMRLVNGPNSTSVIRTAAVNNPIISIWDTHGVAARDWAPNTPLHLGLDDPGTGDSLQWTVITDEDGNFWDVPPDPQWQVLQPGWIASATGSVENREVATLTKTLALPDPLPFPTSMSGNVVTGTLAGTATAESIGAGSYLEARAVCRATDWPQRAQVTAPDGKYKLDFTAAPAFPWGNGDACGLPTHYYGFGFRDLDGDELSLDWHVIPQPSVVVPDLVYNGQPGDVTGGGWDLMSVEISQCQMNGTAVVGCDPTTRLLTNDYPDPLWDQYPDGHAQLEENIVFQRYLEIKGQTVDCATATCAVVVTEPNRTAVQAFAALTYGFDPYIEVGPSNNLVGGETLTVTGRDFPPNTTFPIDIAQGYGSPNGGLVDHSTWWMGSVTSSTDGSFTVPLTAARQLHISPMPSDPKLDVDCATVAPAGNDRCGVFAYWSVIPSDPSRDIAEFFIPLGYQPPTGAPGPPGAPGATGATGATGPTGPAGIAPLVAIFAPGNYSAKTGKKLKVPYALSEASTVTAKLTRKSVTLTKSVKGAAGANTLSWKLTKGKKPLAPGKYRLSLCSANGNTLTTITVKVVR